MTETGKPFLVGGAAREIAERELRRARGLTEVIRVPAGRRALRDQIELIKANSRFIRAYEANQGQREEETGRPLNVPDSDRRPGRIIRQHIKEQRADSVYDAAYGEINHVAERLAASSGYMGNGASFLSPENDRFARRVLARVGKQAKSRS